MFIRPEGFGQLIKRHEKSVQNYLTILKELLTCLQNNAIIIYEIRLRSKAHEK